MNELQQKIVNLKKEKNALILAHYYQTSDIQEIADHVCDSFEMARRAHVASEDLLVVCGVTFMAESAKILNPGKTVLLPNTSAGCPMADMITAEDVIKLRRAHPDAVVVCYVNSSADVKAVSDICCTSSSAEKIVRALPETKIIFIPDRNLGSYIASKIPEKEVVLFEGYCPTHDKVTEQDIISAKKAYPNAKALVHPECRPDVLTHADYIGSTAGIIKTATESDCGEFIIGTEVGVLDHLDKAAPNKKFYPLSNGFVCPNMKKTRLSDVLNSLENYEHIVELPPEKMDAARKSLERMVELG